MKKNTLLSIVSGSFWGILAKIFDALAKFATIPMLVGYYGKADYGLIALAFSLNAYLRLMDLGMNVGSVRFFSIWMSNKEWDKVGAVSRSSIVFYGVIGVVNAVVFIIMAHHGKTLFNITSMQEQVFKGMMYVLAIGTVMNWLSNVVIQLLSSHNELSWINRTTLISSLFNLITAFLAIKFDLSLSHYFILYTLSTLLPVPLNIYRLKIFARPLRFFLAPIWNGKAFKEILNYSMAIFAMGIFQVTANNLRPLLLSKFSSDGVGALTEYRVIQTIIMLVLAFGGVFMQVLLPSTSKIYAENNRTKLERVIYTGTKYISVFFSLIVFLIILNSHTLLYLYMGESYSHLNKWLVIWSLTVLVSMHNAPVASLVLSSGKTRFLVYSSAISCFLSLPITVFFAKQLNVGAAVVGYAFYIALQIIFYYAYYIPKILKINSLKLLLGSFLPTAFLGGISTCLVIVSNRVFASENPIWFLITNSTLFVTIFIILNVIFVVKPKELLELKKQFIK